PMPWERDEGVSGSIPAHADLRPDRDGAKRTVPSTPRRAAPTVTRMRSRSPRRGLLQAVVGVSVACLAAAGCSSGGSGRAKPDLGKGKIAVLLPDTASSTRWESDDRRYLASAFRAEGLSDSDFTIDNAQGDPSNQQDQAEQAITNGASVLLLVNLDSGSGAAI